MSLDPDITRTLLRRIKQSEQELDFVKDRQQEVIALNDRLRDLVYKEWKPAGFDPADRETWPPALRDQGVIMELLDNLNLGVGYTHELVIEHRYPELHRKPEPTPPAPQPQQQQAPVVVQTQPSAPAEGGRVRSFWTGWWETRIERMRLQAMERQLEARRVPMDVTTERVAEDPVDAMGSRLLGALNATKKFLTDCYLCWPSHVNRFYATLVHENFRARLSRLMGVIESFVYAATNLLIKELTQNINNQMGYFTRILEAQAGTPVTVQEFRRPYLGSGGLKDTDFESLRPRRTQPLGAGPVEPEVLEAGPEPEESEEES